MFKRFGLFASIAIMSLLVLAACGGDDDSNGNGDSGSSVDMEMGEMYFDPEEVSADAGSEMTINFDNAGNQLHDFTIDDFNGERIHVEVASGEEDSVTLTMPDEAGEFEYYCTIPGHRDAGMHGTLTVN